MKLLVTGVAGFIGFHLARRLIDEGHIVYGVDNLNSYYEVELKRARLALLQAGVNFHFWQANLADRSEIERIFAEARPERVIHLAAQAGVRYSITNPHAYIESN